MSSFFDTIIKMKLKEKTIKKHKLYHGKILDFYVDDVLSYNGDKCTREYTVHPYAVAAIVKVGNKYILEKQYRYPVNKITLEIPAGKADPNETPIKSIRREVIEETGYKPKIIKPLGYFYPSVAFCTERIYLFYIEVENKKVNRHLDKDEAINLVYYSKEEIISLIKSNKIDDCKTIVAFYKYFLLK